MRRSRCGPIAAAAIPDEYGDAGRLVIGKEEIQVAVTIEIGGRDVIGVRPGREGGARRLAEVAPAIAQQDRNRTAHVIGDDEVEVAVDIYIQGRDAAGNLADPDPPDPRRRVVLRLLRRPAAGRQEDEH
jgi:hypothetical protein